MIAFYDMMKKTIVMPAHLMEDGKHVRASMPACPSCYQPCLLCCDDVLMRHALMLSHFQ